MRRALRSLLVTTLAVVPITAALVWIAHLPSAATVAPDAGAGGGVGGAASPHGDAPVVVVRVHAWGFTPRVIQVAPGQRVRFAAVSDDIQHGFAINELGVNLALRPGREARSAEVIVSLPEGTYAIHCSVFCGLGHPSMKGRLVVGTPAPTFGQRAPWIATLLTVALAFAVVGVARTRPRP